MPMMSLRIDGGRAEVKKTGGALGLCAIIRAYSGLLCRLNLLLKDSHHGPTQVFLGASFSKARRKIILVASTEI